MLKIKIVNIKYIFAGIGYLFLPIIAIILLLSNFFNESKILEVMLPVLISLAITFLPVAYNFIFKRPKLAFDIEAGRCYLIKNFEIKNATYPNPEAKYIRINLCNKGSTTAKNCSVKIFIYYNNFELVREPTNLYPSGYHNLKKEGERPPLLDIAAGDSQIFDICSATYDPNPLAIRFEDYYTYSRIEAKLNPLSLRKCFYIDIFGYSDNNSPIRKQFKIFHNTDLSEIRWEQIDIKEINCKEEIKSLKNITIQGGISNNQNHQEDILTINSDVNNDISKDKDNKQSTYQETNKNERREDSWTTGNINQS